MSSPQRLGRDGVGTRSRRVRWWDYVLAIGFFVWSVAGVVNGIRRENWALTVTYAVPAVFSALYIPFKRRMVAHHKRRNVTGDDQ